MKSHTLIKLLKVIFVSALLCMNIISTASLKTSNRAFAVFSFNNSNVSLNGPSQNNFKGHVALDSENRGIIITAGDGAQNESLMRLVSEKVDSDSYLIDYRLMRSCDFPLKITKNNKNINLTFSPKSLENRNKNDNFAITVEIFNFRSFITDDKYKSEDDIKDFLKNQCQERKNHISGMKSEFKSAVSEYHRKYKELKSVQQKLSSQSSEVENLRTAIADAENQIKDINYLQNSYEMQMKSISSITSGASKLIGKESDKKNELSAKKRDLEKEYSENSEKIKLMEEKLTKLKENYAKTMEKSKDVENLIINHQKDLADVENSISNLRSSKLRVDYDLKASKEMRSSTENSSSELKEQISKYNIKNDENLKKISKLKTEKLDLENFITDEKEDIKRLEGQINDLILKKSKKEENLKSKFDLVKNKEEQITTMKIENEQFVSNIKRLNDKREKLETTEKSEILKKISNLKGRLTSYKDKLDKFETEQKKITSDLLESNTKKDMINKRISENNKEIEETNVQILNLNKKRVELDKKKAELNAEIKDKENKLKNLRLESQNYNGEVENVKKSLTSAHENLQTFKSILSDFSNKLKPAERGQTELITNKNNFENDIKNLKMRINSSASQLKKNTPSAVVMIDLAEDEAFNDSLEDSAKPKWRILIDKIIS